MNFITNLSANKRRDNVYDAILMMIDRFIKMSKYISMIKIIDVAKLTNVFFEKIMLRYDMSNDIMNNKNNVFTNVFWSSLCFHAKIRKRLNSAFHSQTNESIERQNQMFEHYFKTYVNTKQSNWAKLLSLTKFAYNNNHHNFVDFTSFYIMYEFHFEIKWKIENNFLQKKMLFANERIKQFQA